MKLKDIKNAVDNKDNVKWVSDIYYVLKDKNDNYYIKCLINENIIGLTHKDNKTLNGNENDFYIKLGEKNV